MIEVSTYRYELDGTILELEVFFMERSGRSDRTMQCSSMVLDGRTWERSPVVRSALGAREHPPSPSFPPDYGVCVFVHRGPNRRGLVLLHPSSFQKKPDMRRRNVLHQ